MQKKIKYENDIHWLQSHAGQGKIMDIPWISMHSLEGSSHSFEQAKQFQACNSVHCLLDQRFDPLHYRHVELKGK